MEQVVEEMKGDQARVEDLRARMWRSRTRTSRPVGILMLIVSGMLFLLAFATGSILAEVSSLTAFILGALLLVSDFEQRVRLIPSAEAIEGPVKSTVALLKEKGWAGRVSFVPGTEGVKMTQQSSGAPSFFPLELVPYGHDLVEYYELEAGPFEGKGLDFAKEWLPRVLRDAAGLVGSASITANNNEVKTVLVRPFVRPLCVKPFFTENVCGTLGCPLVNSVGEALALSSGKTVSHVTCRYDPTTQTATAVHSIS